MNTRRFALLAACAGVIGFSSIAPAAVVINEVQYDDTGSADDRQFVELYNNGATAVEIGGWVLGGRDATTTNVSTTIPAGTVLQPGAFYVIGNSAVANVNLVVTAADFVENDAETVELRTSAGGTLVDALLYEGNKAQTITLPADVSAKVNAGGNAASPGYWGNHQGVDLSTNTTTVSIGRYIDGVDTSNNGRDFGTRPATPGASNLAGGTITSTYTPANVDALAVDSNAPGLQASFGGPDYGFNSGVKVINPTQTSTYNQNAITASPQGGNAITLVDTSGGGNAAVSYDVHQGGGTFNIDAYLETADAPGTESETTMFGTVGNVGSLFNIPDPSGAVFAATTPSAGDGTGIGWLYQRFGATAKLYLVDAGDGGNSSPDVSPQEWTVLTTIDLSEAASGWHQLAISVAESGAGFALFDGQRFDFTTAANLNGEFYVGYREALAGTPAAPGSSIFRPPTFDISTSPIPEPTSLALVGLAGLGLARRRRRN